MNRLSYVKAVAAVAVLTIALVPSLRRSSAESQPTREITNVPAADLRNEERIIGKYFDDLVQYQRECWQAKKRTTLRAADIDPLQRKSDDLKSRLSEVQNAVGEVVRKLKAAGEWDDLDTKLLASTTDGNSRTLFQQSSFKADLEEAAANLSSQKNEISAPLDNLRKRIAAGTVAPNVEYGFAIVPASYRPLTPMANASLGCRLGVLKLKIIKQLGGISNCATHDAVSCACNPTKGGICTGSDCPGQATS